MLQPDDLRTLLFFERFGKISHRAVFESAGDDHSATRGTLQRADDGEIHRLGAARGEDEFARSTTQQSTRRFAGQLELLPYLLADAVHARGIGPALSKGGVDDLDHFL